MDLFRITTEHTTIGEAVQGDAEVDLRGTITAVCSSSQLTGLCNEYQLIV